MLAFEKQLFGVKILFQKAIHQTTQIAI